MHRLVLVLLIALATPAWSAFVLTLDQTSVSGTPGTLITISGSLLNENPTMEDVVNIASTTFTSGGATLTQVFAPNYISYSGTYAGNLIELMIVAASPGLYPAELSFGYDTLNGRLASTNVAGFSVEVLPVAAVPEPGSLWLSLAALPAAWFLWRRRRSDR